MTHDATVDVTCDHDGCNEWITIQLPFVYSNSAGVGGVYDHRLRAIKSRIEAEYWTVIGKEEEHRTFCPQCSDRLASIGEDE